MYFNRKHVRYIAVNDGVDTSREDNDIAPFKNILNDMYARDLSRKVKSAKRQRATKGYYISAQTPYGYKVDPADRNHLIVDEEAAEVVREIFALALAGNSLTRISRILTERRIATPGAYKLSKGDMRFLRYQDENASSGWCYQTIRKILRDQVYTGDMVNHRYEILNYKTKERTPVPKEQHIIVADRHEPIVSREDFARLTRTDYSVEGWSNSYEGYTYNTSQTDAVSDGALTDMRMTNNSYLDLEYNSLGRKFSRHIGFCVLERYYYKAGETSNSSSMVIDSYEVDLAERSIYGFQYRYDENGNIERINELFSNTSVSYTYDNQNQLTGAVYSDGRTESYTYDTVGNLLSFNNGTTVHSYTYGNSDWKDLLTAVDGTAISYDAIGNPTSYYNGTSYAMSWSEGRKLASVTIGGQTTSYLYNADGTRIRKNNSDGSYILYLVADGTIIGEKHCDSNGTATKYLRYIFDDNGTVCGYERSTNGTSWWNYYFVRNIQGDVLHVYGSYEEMIVANYTYDSWGNILTSSGEMAEENPFRYRGYYYDAETGFYYLNSRYYDPEIGRFINGDGYVATGTGVLGYNMFAYCNNNPIKFVDFGGDILQSFVDDGNDLNDFFDDVMGGAGAGGRVYHYKVDFSVATRSTITYGGLHNCGVMTYGYTTSPMDATTNSTSNSPSGVGNPVKSEGRGSTGRTTPNSLNEQMAMHQVQSNPLENAVELTRIEMSDPRWLASEGWVKMQSTVHYFGGKTIIHFDYNKETGAFDDFKFKWSD